MIFYKEGHTKPTLPKTELCDHGCYIHQNERHLMDLVLEYLPLLPIVDMKIKKNREVFKYYVHLFHYMGHNNINVCNCNRINVVMASPN